MLFSFFCNNIFPIIETACIFLKPKSIFLNRNSITFNGNTHVTIFNSTNKFNRSEVSYSITFFTVKKNCTDSIQILPIQANFLP